MTKPKPSALQGTASTISTQNQGAGLANQNTAQGTLAQYEGPVQQSGLYKALYNSGTQATSDAYQNAAANTAAKANAAGFGEQTSGVTQGAEAQTGAAGAKALAQVPEQATIAATAPQLQAASTTAGIGASQQGEGVQWAQGVEEPLVQQQQDQSFQAKNALWQSLLGVGESVIGENPKGIFD
jgi:hypothetical protein